MVEHVDDADVIAVVCSARGNVYQYFEKQLHVEQSWRGSPSQEIPSGLWNAKINYRLNIIHIPCIKNIVHIVLKNAFSVDKYLNCVITKYMLFYMFQLQPPTVRTSVYEGIMVVGM